MRDVARGKSGMLSGLSAILDLSVALEQNAHRVDGRGTYDVRQNRPSRLLFRPDDKAEGHKSWSSKVTRK